MASGTDGSLVATLANVEPAVRVRGGFIYLCPSREHGRDRDDDETGSTSRG